MIVGKPAVDSATEPTVIDDDTVAAGDALEENCESSKGHVCKVAAMALFSAVGSFLFGLDIGYIGPIVESNNFKKNVLHLADSEETPSELEGLIVSLFSIGCIVMSFPLISSYFLDVWGRKLSIMFGSVIFMAGSALQASADSLLQMETGRFVTGLSIGLLSSAVVLYQSELAPTHLRGAFSTLYQFMIAFGILVASFIDQLMVETEGGWRHVIWLMCLPALILLIAGMLFLPRSPRWLIQKGRHEEALRVLRSIRSEQDAVQELEDMKQEQLNAEAMGEPLWADIFQGHVGRLLALGVALQLLQQLVGMNAFMYFGPKIFESIRFKKNQFTTINNSVNFVATFPAILLSDRAGRCTLLLCSGIGMSLSCLVMGTIGSTCMSEDDAGNWTVSSSSAGWAIAASIFFFVLNFAYGFGPVVWTYCAEMFPSKYRARCMG
eukprot:TRINITY_DN23486_c0_g1_i1.p1 TRINITY_DN23486_c0_g1~~TRINITY_DN23486_c0_g1_i1.p1  ORF type:complete len:437 (+),score=75.76 TRINITY_DN23486_c0_g1_i1:192-1502(+)